MNISIVCLKSKVLATGESPLMVQIFKDGKRKYQSLGVSVNPAHWDFKRNKPKANCPNGEYLHQIVLNKVTELQKQVLTFKAADKDFTITNILNNKPKLTVKTVGEFYTELIADFKQTGKTGNRRVYSGSLTSIKTFAKGRTNFLFSDIDVQWLQRYEKWLRSKGNRETTISVLFRTLRSAYNRAIEAKCTVRDNYPFGEFKVSKFNVTTSKRAISKQDILRIKDVDLNNESESIQLARDIFIFSYLSGGMNFTDIANLQPHNINEERLNYTRQKTGKNISIQLAPDATRIIDSYRPVTLKSGYLFPILNGSKHTTPQSKANRIHKILGSTDTALKRIASLVGIKTNLTTYVARHSFATVLKHSGVNISMIGELLGHSDPATTQIYLDSFDSNQCTEAMQHLL